jgi:hypothetical protein
MLKIDAGGRQIHCQGSLLMIHEAIEHIYLHAEPWAGEEVARAAASAAGLVLLRHLEERLDWSTSEMINWERERGFDPNYELTKRCMRVDSTYDVDASLRRIRRFLKRGQR